jgi:TolB-like protein
MSADQENEFFADGIAEEIINALTKVRALDVVSRSSAFAFKKRAEDVTEIGRKLKVRTVLEGSVRKAGNRLRITAQLVDVETRYHLWAERYDREMADVFAIQDEIATNIVNALKLVLTEKEEAGDQEGSDAERARIRVLSARPPALSSEDDRTTLDARRTISGARSHSIQTMPWRTRVSRTARRSGQTKRAEAKKRSRRRRRPVSARSSSIPIQPKRMHPAVSHCHTRSDLSKRSRNSRKQFGSTRRLYEAAYFYGRMLQTAGKPDRAIEMYERAVALRPDDYQALSFLAMAEQARGDMAKAEDASRPHGRGLPNARSR